MFYKRISDLHPLGKPTDNDWNEIEPIPLPDSSESKIVVSEPTSIIYTELSSKVSATNIPSSQIDTLNTEMSKALWYSDTSKELNYTDISLETIQSKENDSELSSEYYAKSLWFEVAIAKNNKNAPTGSIQDIAKYQSKRMNAYLMFKHLDDLNVKSIASDYVSANNISCNILKSDLIFADKGLISSSSLSARYANISSLNNQSITANAISATDAVINNLVGTNVYYANAEIGNLVGSNSDLAEKYVADNSYPPGTLVKFGGEKEITIANDKANAVVSENPAIVMNNSCKEEYATPIVLSGRSNIRVIHPVKKFNKIYLSELPGVGTTEEYKISSSTIPIGIALESKSSNEEGLVECIIQMNLD